MRWLAPLLAAALGCGSAQDVHRLAVRGVLGAPTPATELSGVLYVAAAVNGVPGHLLVDTGAPVTVLSARRFPGAGLPDGAGVADALAIGDLLVERVPSLSLDLFGDRPGFVPGGILGANVLCQFTAVLDYRARAVRLGGPPPTDVPGAALPGARLPLRLEGGGRGTLQGTSFAFPATRILVTALVDGKPRTLVLDSGASYIVLRDAAWRELAADGRPTLEGVPIRSADGPIVGRLTRARSVSVAGEEVQRPAVLDVGDPLLDGFEAEVGRPVDGLLGGSFLREFLVVLDFPGAAVRLARYAARDHVDPHELHQVGLLLEEAAPGSGHRYAIGTVFAGTDAERAGLAVGQIVTAIGGTAIDALGAQEALRLLRGPVGETRRIEGPRGAVDVRIDDLLP